MSKPLQQMSKSELNAYFAAYDEQPMHRRGGAITFLGNQAEYRARHPLLAAKRERKRRRTTAEVSLQLDEMAVRMQASDRRLRELGLL